MQQIKGVFSSESQQAEQARKKVCEDCEEFSRSELRGFTRPGSCTERGRLRVIADSEIAWRQDAVDADIATDEEKSALAAWRKYRVLLMRVDTAAPVWPIVPEV